MSHKSERPYLPIFVAEDDEDDRLLLEDAFLEADPAGYIRFAVDGIELLEELEGRVEEDTPLIILDLHMPRMNGSETLRALRKHPDFALAPIIILSTSDAPEDIDRAYALGANTFFTKPASFEELVGFVRSLTQYWYVHARMPQLMAYCA